MAKKKKQVAKSDAEELREEPKDDVAQTMEEMEAIEAKLREQLAAKEASLPRCGHVNTHSRDEDNKLDNLVCTLADGHDGKHSAKHLERDPMNPTEFAEFDAQWSDAAGADWVEPIVPELAVAPPPGWVATRQPDKYDERK